MSEEPDVGRIGRLAAEMALTYNWISLYQEGHPSLAGRVEKFHKGLVEAVNAEPSGRLLLGIAKGKILYRNVFLDEGNSLVRSFTSGLFLQQVATIDFSDEVTPRDLLVFFLTLHRLRVEKSGGKLDEILKGEGVRGIGVYSCNYKEVLSRKILLPGREAPSANREDELWRMILTENVPSGTKSDDLPGNLQIPPDLIPAIVRRMNAAGRESRRDAMQESGTDALSSDMIRRVLDRLGEALDRLPVEERVSVLLSLDEDPGNEGNGVGHEEGFASADIVRSLTATDSNDEFLDMMATLLTVEKKSGNRFRKIFEIIAAERNGDGSLLPAVRNRVRESVRTKNYYAQRTWETIERLLLQRTESAYLGQDHSRLLEKLSPVDAETAVSHEESGPADPSVLAEFEEENLHLKGAGVLLDLLAEEENEGEFLELLEEIRKIIANLVSRRELPLLKTLLSTLTSLHRNAPEERKAPIARAIGEVDFAHMIDLYLSPSVPRPEKARIEKILISGGITFGELRRFVIFLAEGAGAPSDQVWESIVYGRIEGAESAGGVSLESTPASRTSGVMATLGEVLKDVLVSMVTERKKPRVEEGRDIVSSIMKGLRQEGMLIERLLRLQSHDDYTVTHSLNVCILVVAQAVHIGLPENRTREAGLAALLHDIGKETTPSGILTKPGRLDSEEFDLVKRHPAAGAKLLRKIDCGTVLPMIVAFEHHIKYDRTGYPKVDGGQPLHIASHMTQIADVYDALRSSRAYRSSVELKKTVSIMKEGRGTEFEPRLFDGFVEILS